MNAEVDAMVTFIREIIREELGNVVSPFLYATYVGPETEDANLSKVTLPGGVKQARYVPKLEHVTGLVSGQTLMCVKGKGTPLTIIGRVTGNITLALV